MAGLVTGLPRVCTYKEQLVTNQAFVPPSLQVLQLPIVKSRIKKLLQGAVKKVALLGAPVIPSSDDSLEQFSQAVGRFFGKDPAKWDQVGGCSALRMH